jgi:nucleotide-binding universal stress UspA family protein
MKNFIVPTDFSELSLGGVELAFFMAQHFESKITLVHVTRNIGNDYSVNIKQKYDKLKQSMEAIIARFGSGNKVEVDYIIKEGKVYESVVNQAEAAHHSFICVATHGQSGWEELFIGSNAYKIVSSAKCPVFTIRGKKVPQKIQSIVLPLDNTLETREKVPLTAALALAFKAKVHVLAVNSSDYSEIQAKLKTYAMQVCGYLEHYKINCTLDHKNGGNITDLTLEYAKEKNADMISIMTEQEKNLTNVLMGSYAHQMINKSPIPVLLFPTKQIGIITESFKTEGIEF